MHLRPRTQEECFSGFVEFKSKPDSMLVDWKFDIRLSKNIRKLLDFEDYKSVSSTVIVLTLVKKIQEQYNSLIHEHLVAYLQNSCFNACNKIYQDLKIQKDFIENIELENLFLDANKFLWQKDIFDTYDFQSSSLDTYATHIVRKKLLSSIFDRFGDSSTRSTWGVLKCTGERKINRALDIVEIFSPRTRSDYLNLINSYKINCGSTSGLKEGNSALISKMESIAEEFNRLSGLCGTGNIITPNEVIKILKECAKAIRKLDSVQREFSPEDSEISIFDKIPSVQTHSSLDELIDLVNRYLEECFTNSSHKTMKAHDIFLLHHGLGYKDNKIGVLYNCNQSTVFRFRSSAYSPILGVVRDGVSRIFCKQLDDPHLIKIIQEVLDAIYHEKLNEMLHMIGNDILDSSSIAILSVLYELKNKRNSSSQNLIQKIANKRGVSAVHIEETIKQMQFVLSDALLSKLKEAFDPNLSTDSIGGKIYEFVESWIGISIE